MTMAFFGSAYHAAKSTYALDQFHHRRRKRLGLFLRQIMAGARYHAMAAPGGELRRAGGAVGRGYDPIACTVHGNRRHRDDRQRRQPALDVSILRVAFGKAKAVPVAVDHHIDVVRIVVGRRRALETGIVELPVRRPLRPQYLRDLAPVGGKAGAATLELKVILVPQRQFALRTQRHHGVGNILDQIGIDADEADAALRPQRRSDASRPATPIVAREYRTFDVKRIHQRHHVCADSRLLARARRRGIAKPRRTVAAQIGNDDAAALRGQLRRDVDIGVNVIGKAVHQHHGRPVGRSRLVIGNVENAGIDLTQRFQAFR